MLIIYREKNSATLITNYILGDNSLLLMIDRYVREQSSSQDDEDERGESENFERVLQKDVRFQLENASHMTS